jgi:hypothetical protein
MPTQDQAPTQDERRPLSSRGRNSIAAMAILTVVTPLLALWLTSGRPLGVALALASGAFTASTGLYVWILETSTGAPRAALVLSYVQLGLTAVMIMLGMALLVT